jgi:N6-L-threonylcarbamoyladenine synthase
VTGGVSANSRLRAKGLEWAKKEGVELVIPPLRYCTDNAAMIGYAGIQRLNRGERSDFEMGVSPEMSL